MKYMFGWTPDSGNRPRRMFRAIKMKGAAPRGSADLRPSAPAHMDQNLCGSCEGHGNSTAITTAYTIAGKPLFGFDADGLPVPCSPRDIYAGGRCVDRLGLPIQLVDEGAETLDVIEYVTQFGVRRIQSPVMVTDPDTGDSFFVNSDCSPANVNVEPTLAELEADSLHIVPVPYEITSDGARRITDVCLALDAGHPVVFGTRVATPFMEYTGGIIGTQSQSDPNGGGHCMVLLGYTTDAGKRVFIGRNSWGTIWGEGGDFRCSEAFVIQIWELFAIVVPKD